MLILENFILQMTLDLIIFYGYTVVDVVSIVGYAMEKQDGTFNSKQFVYEYTLKFDVHWWTPFSSAAAN